MFLANLKRDPRIAARFVGSRLNPAPELYFLDAFARQAQHLKALNELRVAHAEWNDKTFGAVGPVGSLKHLAEEALEAAENPADTHEFADCQLLLWDAQRRAGISDEDFLRACQEKLYILKKRDWAKVEDGQPVHHIDTSKLERVVPECSPGLPGNILVCFLALAMVFGAILGIWWS